MLNSVLWNRQITRKNKLLIYNSIVESIVTYGAETRKFNKNLELKLMSMEMDFLRRSARCSRLEKNRNNVIREKNEYYKFCFNLYKIQTVELVWPRANNGWRKLPRKMLDWCPMSTWKKNKTKTSKFVNAGVTTGIWERREETTWNGWIKYGEGK